MFGVEVKIRVFRGFSLMEYLIFFVDLIYKFWLFRSMIYYLVGIFKSNIIEIGF